MTSDGARLAGWYVESRNGAAVIRSPAVQRHAAMLIRHGYGVLVFDRRGEGESEGDPTSSAGPATGTWKRLWPTCARAPMSSPRVS